MISELRAKVAQKESDGWVTKHRDSVSGNKNNAKILQLDE